jgi:serine/threonine protein kinase
MSPHADPSRDLLFGLLALQTGLVQQSQLVAAFHAWTQGKARPMAEILVDQKAIDPSHRSLLEGLADAHLQRHGGDPEKSLAALAVGPSTRESLKQIGDPEIEATLSLVGSGSTEDGRAERTATYAIGTETGEGQRFRVLRPHAQGGLGAVFVALDRELNREVALKQILNKLADNPESRARFVLEAEITGGLEHPGIVPVYGLGAYADGRPFYAMRFIQGDSLKEAIARFHDGSPAGSAVADPTRTLQFRNLLRRFTDVCNAIDYAHSRGVLHRDIKPGNVIVGKHGETLVVDWGLAKAVGRTDAGAGSEERALAPSSASGSAETLPGSALGTPGYMSPEQARGALDALGPRSDVYSLGATLYCLLTGRPPFEGGDPGTLLRRVQAGEFPAPRALDPAIDRALEAVCLKAMALKPEDRYPSPKALADDVERWTADEPVSAWREPPARRARRWARRNRTAVTGAAAALLAGLIGLTAVAAVQATANDRLRKANDEIGKALAETTKAKKATEVALAESEESRRRAEAVLTFLKDGVLAATRPEGQEGGLGKDVTVRKAVDAAESKIAGAFKDQPAVEAEVRHTLGLTYWYLSEAPLAIRQHKRALELLEAKLGPDHPDTLSVRNNLAGAYLDAGRTAEAVPLLEASLKLREAKLGPDHPDTLSSRNNLAEAYRAAGRTAEAITLHEQTFKLREAKLGPDHPGTLTSRNNLALAYRIAGRTAEAVALHEGTLRLREAKLGATHPETLLSRSNLAEAYRAAGRVDEAVALHEGTLRLREEKLGADHLGTLQSRNNLASAYRAAGRTAEAINLHEATLKICEAKLGPDHPQTLASRNNLAQAYCDAGRAAEAVALLEAMLPAAGKVFGPDHPNTLTATSNLAGAYESLGRRADAEPLRREVLARRRKAAKPDTPLLAGDLSALGFNLLKQSKWSEAEPLLREGLAIRAKAAPDDWTRFDAMSLLGEAVLGQGRYDEAEPLVVQGYEGLKARAAKIPAPDKPRLREAADRLVRLYESWGKPEQVAAWKARLGLADLPKDVFIRP